MFQVVENLMGVAESRVVHVWIGNGDGIHTGGARSCDTGRRILKNQAMPRIGVHSFRRDQEYVRRGLAVFHLRIISRHEIGRAHV